MTAALELEAPHYTVLDVHPQHSTAAAAASVSSSLRSSPTVSLPFRISVKPNSTHAALAAYITSYGFLCLLLFAGLNMRMLSSPSLSAAAGERSEHIVVFCCYSLGLMLALLFFAYYVYRVLSGGMLRARTVRASDRVLLDAEWWQGQQSRRLQYELSSAVSVWTTVRDDHAVRSVLQVLLSLYCCLTLLWRASQLSSWEAVVLVLASATLLTAAALTDDLFVCLAAFALSDWLQPVLDAFLLGCPVLDSVRHVLMLAAGQLTLCSIMYLAARLSSRPAALLLFSAIIHTRLLLVSPTPAALFIAVACSLCSFTLHRLASQQPHSAAAMAGEDGSEDDADISDELWRARQFACMAAVYAVASNGWRCVHCWLGDGKWQDGTCVAVLVLLAVVEYKLRERHKKV